MPSPPAPDARARQRAAVAFAGTPALVAFAIAAMFLWLVPAISGPEGTYPLLLAIGVLAVGGVNLVRDLLAVRARTDTTETGDPIEAGDEVHLTRSSVARLGAFCVVLLASLVLLEPLGFFPAMVVMVLGALVCFDIRDPWTIVAATALVVGFSYLVFVRLLAVPFPAGFLGLT